MTEKANNVDATNLRQVAVRGTDQTIAQLTSGINLTALLRINLLLVADLLDIYEGGGVDLPEWTAARSLVQSVLGGDPFPRGTDAPSKDSGGADLSVPPKQSLVIAKGSVRR
jgi:hypothetical protein